MIWESLKPQKNTNNISYHIFLCKIWAHFKFDGVNTPQNTLETTVCVWHITILSVFCLVLDSPLCNTAPTTYWARKPMKKRWNMQTHNGKKSYYKHTPFSNSQILDLQYIFHYVTNSNRAARRCCVPGSTSYLIFSCPVLESEFVWLLRNNLSKVTEPALYLNLSP